MRGEGEFAVQTGVANAVDEFHHDAGAEVDLVRQAGRRCQRTGVAAPAGDVLSVGKSGHHPTVEISGGGSPGGRSTALSAGQRIAVTGAASMSSKDWFSPAIAQMNE
ncbi:hypothetical protein Acsp01_31970 [Actinoplanes sp. NBRC 101535]|nr:hypothetical protein Acsp01_31970 [Actinoplanes sp. NBRC 101535]